MEHPTEPSTEEASPACTNCGTILVGKYCFECGQKRLPPDHLSMRHFVQEAIVHVGDFEHTKIYRTLRALLLKPGRLTIEYIGGRRAEWITPLKIFLTLFALSFFLYSAFKTAALYNVSTLLAIDTSGNWRKIIEAAAERRNLPVDAFITAVNAKWRTYVSLSQFIYPLPFALALMALYARQRRYFVEHLVFSTHFQAFGLLVAVLAWPMYMLTGLALKGGAAMMAFVLTAAMIGYVIVAVRRVYGQSWLVSSVKGVLLYAGYYLIYSLLTFGTLVLAVRAVRRGG